MLTPIETLYAGCRFRSRLEARWAVFFDVFQLKWRYEPDGFRLPSGRCYLPDFLIDGVGFVEIKPTTDSDNGKIVELGDMLQTINMKAYCIYGDVPNPLDIEPWGFGPWNPPDGGIYAADDDSPEYWFAICRSAIVEGSRIRPDMRGYRAAALRSFSASRMVTVCGMTTSRGFMWH